MTRRNNTRRSRPSKPSRWESASLGNKLAIVGIILTILGFGLSHYLGNPSREKDTHELESIKNQSKSSPDPGCGFPAHFVRDTLYVLITRFEDFENENDTECYGRNIERRIDRIVQKRKLPILFCYRDDLSPNQTREAEHLRDESHADLIIWGKLSNAGPDCNADSCCLLFCPSDTLILYAGGEVSTAKLDNFQPDISASDIEKGLINMGRERFDDWLVGMFNLKIGQTKPELFVIDNSWDKEKQIEAYITRGNIWLSFGHYLQTIIDHEKALKLDPNLSNSYVCIGFAKSMMGNGIDALFNYNLALEIDPQNEYANHNIGTLKFKLGLYDEAILNYNKCISANPKSLSAYFGRAAAFSKSVFGNWILACNRQILFHPALKFSPDRPHTTANFALSEIKFARFRLKTNSRTSSKLSRHAESISDYDHAISIDPGFAGSYSNRGVEKKGLGLYIEAIADFDTAIYLNPKFAGAYSNRGLAKENLGRHAEAISDYSFAIALEPKIVQAYLNRGISKRNLGLYAEAIADLDKVLSLDSEFAPAYRERALAKYHLGNYIGALSDCDQALTNEPNQVELYNNRGLIKNCLGQFTEALLDYNQAILISPKAPEAYINRGVCKNDLGLYKEAILDFEQAILLDPNFAETYNNLGCSKDKLGYFSEAIVHFDKAIKINPDNPLYYGNRLFSLIKNGQYFAAIVDYFRIVFLDPRQAGGLCFLIIFLGYLWKFKTINRHLHRLFTRLSQASKKLLHRP